MNRFEKRLTFFILAIFAATLAIASVGGCTSLRSQLENPTVRLANVSLIEIGLLQQVYGVTLQVDNPNAFTLPIKGVRYSVRLAGQDFASGLTPNAFRIPANGSDQVEVEVRTNLLGSIASLTRLLSDGQEELEYQLSGDIQIDLPLIGAIPFSQSGVVPLVKRDPANR